MNLPFKETLLVDFGLAILAIILGYFLFSFFKNLLLLLKPKKENGDDKSKIIKSFSMTRFILYSFAILFACLIIVFALYIQTFQKLIEQKHIADIYVEEIMTDEPTMRVTLIQKYGPQAGEPYTCHIKGDRWVLEGDFIVWEPWTQFFGLDPVFRIRRIKGEYISSQDEKTKTYRTVYDLVVDEVSYGWAWIYKIGPHLPIIQDVVSYSVARPPSNDEKIKVYVTRNGFETRPVR